jgi:hypothetical protein
MSPVDRSGKRIEAVLARLDTRTEGMAADIAEVKHTLHGNGQPGMVDTVVRHDEKIRALEAGKGLGTKEMAALWTGVVGALLSLAHVIERMVH